MADLIKISSHKFNIAVKQMKRLNNAGRDVRQLWEGYLEDYKQYVNDAWSSQGTRWGKRYKGLSPEYKKLKRRLVGNGKADLILSGKLKRASTGSKADGWYDEIHPLKVDYGIRGIAYAQAHQFGNKNMPQRPYFANADGSIPIAVLEKFLDAINKYFGESI